ERGRRRRPRPWLAFALDQDRDALPPPLLCAQLAPGTDPLWLADTLLPALHGPPPGAHQRALVRRSARAPAPGLPPDGRSWGSIPPRPAPTWLRWLPRSFPPSSRSPHSSPAPRT